MHPPHEAQMASALSDSLTQGVGLAVFSLFSPPPGGEAVLVRRYRGCRNFRCQKFLEGEEWSWGIMINTAKMLLGPLVRMKSSVYLCEVTGKSYDCFPTTTTLLLVNYWLLESSAPLWGASL